MIEVPDEVHPLSARRTVAALIATVLLAAVPIAPALATMVTGASAPGSIALRGCSEPRDGTTLVRASATPVGTAPCPGVRPGALIGLGRVRCTANFLFTGSDGVRYIGTAGHCTLESGGEILYRAGTGPPVQDAEGDRIGEVAYAVMDEKRDFALIRIDRGVKTKAQMCYFGGPSGIYRDHSPDPVSLTFYGNGAGIGNLGVVNQPVLPARSGMALDTRDRDLVHALMPGNKGDSGAGVTEESTGRAVGVLVSITAHGVRITRLGPQIADAERALSIDLHLSTSS